MDKIMNKSQLGYLSGITFVSIGLIPISIRNFVENTTQEI